MSSNQYPFVRNGAGQPPVNNKTKKLLSSTFSKRVRQKTPLFVASRHLCDDRQKSVRTLYTNHTSPRLFFIWQVEVDAPGGESLAFTLHHGEEDGIAVVGFCRENERVFPDEQECVVTLMQEISS